MSITPEQIAAHARRRALMLQAQALGVTIEDALEMGVTAATAGITPMAMRALAHDYSRGYVTTRLRVTYYRTEYHPLTREPSITHLDVYDTYAGTTTVYKIDRSS